MKVKFFFIITFLCTANFTHAQIPEEELGFADYLIRNNLHREAISLLDKLEKTNQYAKIRDSLNYLKGRQYYWLKEFEQSSRSFDRVSQDNYQLYTESRIFMGINYAQLGQIDSSINLLMHLTPRSEKLTSFRDFHLAGYFLYKRDLNQYKRYASNFNGSFYEFAEQEDNLAFTYQQLNSFKHKSPFVAGMLSALVPGSGKIYAGKKGEGFFNMMLGFLLAGQAVEAYFRAGPESVRFIAGTALFSTFYVANIWGSALAVKRYKDEYNEAASQGILLDLHIPLRRVFP